ncbi:Protein lethal(2)essential for life [Exaiptasia diaphana]|nr:Protein lethal(2)essential for life [Exaiptasia diaphana]
MNNRIKITTVTGLREYKPEEITLKVENNRIYVDGKHETPEKSCEFHRVFSLPDNIQPESVRHRLDLFGELTIEGLEALPGGEIDLSFLDDNKTKVMGCAKTMIYNTSDII